MKYIFYQISCECYFQQRKDMVSKSMLNVGMLSCVLSKFIVILTEDTVGLIGEIEKLNQLQHFLCIPYNILIALFDYGYIIRSLDSSDTFTHILRGTPNWVHWDNIEVYLYWTRTKSSQMWITNHAHNSLDLLYMFIIIWLKNIFIW